MKIWLVIGALLGSAATAQAQSPGDWVLARFKNGNYWFPGVLQSVSGDRLTIQYDDGDRETLPLASVRPYNWTIGSRVECNFKGGGKWFPGKITSLGGTALAIDYDDGDKERTKTGLCRSS